MSLNLINVYVKQYASNIMLLSQQKGSRLESSVMVRNFTGDAAQVVDQIGAIVANKVTSQFAPMPRTDAAIDSRWVFPVDYEVAQIVGSFDKLRILVDPMSSYVENASYALGRAKDDEIIGAYFATAKTGVAGATNTSFLAGNVVNVSVGAAAAAGLNVPKLRAGRKLLMGHNVDLKSESITCVVRSAQHDDLLGQTQVVSTDFNDRPVLVDGEVTRFLGINFIHCERLVTGTDDLAGTSYAIPLYVKSGMCLGIWNDINTSIDKRADLSGIPFQAYAKGTFGATRVEEKKVVKIWCRES